jgi:transcriptional regulator with XRE-family HTH domain
MHSEIKNSLRKELRDREYAEAYSESFLNAYIATQIKVIREQRRMTQGELARGIGTTQTGISRIENVNYTSWSVRTLAKLAKAFDVRLAISFEPYGTLPDEVLSFDRNSLERVPRTEDRNLVEQADEEYMLFLASLKSNVVNIELWKSKNDEQDDSNPLATEKQSSSIGKALCG